MGKQLRSQIIEDSEDDAELVLRELFGDEPEELMGSGFSAITRGEAFEDMDAPELPEYPLDLIQPVENPLSGAGTLSPNSGGSRPDLAGNAPLGTNIDGKGLNICHTLLRAHGDNIWADTELGRGSTFYVELPVLGPQPQDHKPSGGAKNPRITKASRSKGRRILIVDDEALITLSLSRSLSSVGHVVDVSSNAREALEAIGRTKYGCIIMDLRLPGTSGMQLYAQIKAEEPALTKRIVFATGDLLNPETREFINSTGNPWLGKPFTLEELEIRVQYCLNQR